MAFIHASGRRFKTGFALIELLVVVALIAILAALILPSLLGARVAAHNSVCRNNLRQIAIGIALYATDHQHYPVQSHYRSADAGAGVFQITLYSDPVRWSDAIFPYTDFRWNEALYKCPSYPEEAWFDLAEPASVFGSYGYNSIGTGGNGLQDSPENGLWLKESAVLNPADMIEAGDSQILLYRHLFEKATPVGLNVLQFALPIPDDSEDGILRKKVMTARHRGKENMVFADAHVEHGALEKFHWNPEAGRRWSRDHRPVH